MKYIHIVFISIIFYFMFSCTSAVKHNNLPFYHTPDFTPHWKTDKTFPKNIHTITSFSAVDQNGSVFTDKNLRGKISLANFFFTTCGSVCPKMTNNLLRIQDSLVAFKNVQILSFSVTPAEDSVPVLKNYEKENRLNGPFWHLLTGNKTEIYNLARKSFFAEQEAGYALDSTEFLHTEHILLIDQNLHIRGIYNGTVALDMQHILEDIRILEKE